MRKALALFIAWACFAQQPPPRNDATKTVQKKDASQTAKEFLVWLAQVSGLSATSGGLKGIEVDHQGDIWSEPLSGGARQRLTFEGGYSWPVFSADDRSVIAMRGGDIWSVGHNGGDPVKLAHAPAKTASLLGSGTEGIVVLTAEQIGTFSPDSGLFSPFPAILSEDIDTIGRLRFPSRSYDNGQLTVSEWRNGIQIITRGKERESVAENAAQWQPSVSHDRQRLVYVRSADSSR